LHVFYSSFLSFYAPWHVFLGPFAFFCNSCMSLSSTSSCRFFNTIFLWLWWCMAFYSNLFGNPQKNTKNKLPFSFSCDSPFHFQS
jgi:hypothetical protein